MGLKNNMLSMQSGGGQGPLGMFTPQNGEGLGLPGGQVSFNLPRTGQPTPPMNVNMPGGGAMNFSMSRTASSDPVQNIINDIQNPLGGLNVNAAPQQQAPKPQVPSFAMQQGAMPDQWAPIGTQGSPFPIGVENFRSRMMGGANKTTMSPFAFL